jgi:molecular chaperone GrpE
MNDETKTDETPDLQPGASKCDLKNAADDLLKQARKDAAEYMEAAADGEADAEDDPAALSPDQQLLVVEAEKEEIREQLLRSMAELQNVRKRSEKQVADARVYAIEKFAGDLLSVSDNLARALQALSDEDKAGLSEPGQNLLGGIEMTEKELHTALARHGVTAIAGEPGDAFDPNVHQAVSNIPSDQPNGTIAAVFQNGWKIGDRTLRAAMVAVSAGTPQ